MRVPRSWALLHLTAALLLVLPACGGSTKSNAAGPGGGDGGMPDDTGIAADAGPDVSMAPPPVGYPAAHPPAPQVQNLGGLVEMAPEFVPITFPNDPLVTQIESFIGGLGSSAYWMNNLEEYGVGQGTMGPKVHVTTSPFTGATIDDSQIQTWINQAVTAGQLPAFDGNMIYAVFLPPGLAVTLQGGTSCQEFGGYHSQVSLASAAAAPYAVIPRCPSFNGLTGIDVITGSASHELIEASTDPYPQTEPAYTQLDTNDLAWMFVLGGAEIGDMCAQNPTAFFQPPGFPYTVQRTWSNKAAAASHDPCIPAAAGPYFNTAAVLPDMVTLNLGQPVTTLGVKIPVGGSKTIELDLFSDSATPSPGWYVSAMDGATLQGGAPSLSFSFDKMNGQNGDKIHMTIKVTAANQFNVETFLLESQNGVNVNFWVGLVSNQ